jgi:hypothetical protein
MLMQPAGSSEMVVHIYQATQHHTPEDGNVN